MPPRGYLILNGRWDHLDQQDDAKPVSSTATAAALNALQQVGHAQVESFPPDSRSVSGRSACPLRVGTGSISRFRFQGTRAYPTGQQALTSQPEPKFGTETGTFPRSSQAGQRAEPVDPPVGESCARCGKAVDCMP
jgi:hypothetical protein